MITSEVKTSLCFTGFGNPTDEVMTNWFVHLTLFLHAIDRREYETSQRSLQLKCILFLWPLVAIAFLSLHMFALVALGANSYNQVVFGATLGLSLALILHFWVKPFFVELQARLTKKTIAETHQGDEVYEDRYMLRWKHVFLVVLLTLVLPVAVAFAVLDSFHGEIDDDFKTEVILQKIWLGNNCEIDLSDASEILQYKHFVCECTIVGLSGVWLGQFFEWFFLSNKGRIN